MGSDSKRGTPKDSDSNEEDSDSNETWASMYSSDSDAWGQVYLLNDDQYSNIDHPDIQHNPPMLHGNRLYFTLDTLEGEEVMPALRFSLAADDDEKLSILLSPEEASPYPAGMYLATSEGLAFAGPVAVHSDSDDEGNEDNTICVWSLSNNPPPVWTLN